MSILLHGIGSRDSTGGMATAKSSDSREAKIVRTEKALGKAEKAQTEKADKSVIWAFIQHKYCESR